jgi:hypothetical protein
MNITSELCVKRVMDDHLKRFLTGPLCATRLKNYLDRLVLLREQGGRAKQ